MAFRLLFVSIALLVFLAMSWIAYTSLSTSEQLRVVVLTVESLRDDMVTEEHCPQLLEAAEGALRLPQYRAISGWTGTNIVSLLTGLSPFQSGVHTRGQSLDPARKVPLERLAEKGYTVEGVQPFMAMNLYQNLGLSLSDTGGDPFIWLAEKQLADKPFFFWYHYVDTHLPYRSSSPGVNDSDKTAAAGDDARARLTKVENQASIRFDEVRFEPQDIAVVRSLHASSIREFDRWFGTFFSFLKAGGFLRNTILIVTADHGDEYGERGMVGHASTTLAGHLHEEIVHIPFFIWLPEKLAAGDSGRYQSDLFSHLDVMPTLFDLLDIRIDDSLSGRSVFRRTSANHWTAMTSSGGFAEPDPGNMRYFEYALIQDNWKSRLRVFADGSEETYLHNLETDPAEAANLAAKHPEIVSKHRKILAPLIAERLHRPITESRQSKAGGGPAWIRPARSGTYSYDSLDGVFDLHWEDTSSKKYIIEYKAGTGLRALSGTLEADSNVKDFGTITRSYWNTWIVPASPISIRVKAVDSEQSSFWITLEVVP